MSADISGTNGIFNHTHIGPVPSTDVIPFYSISSLASSYLAPATINIPSTVLASPNNSTTFSNIVYKNITEIPVGIIMLANKDKDIQETGFIKIANTTKIINTRY
jgi:hypothetical protein